MDVESPSNHRSLLYGLQHIRDKVERTYTTYLTLADNDVALVTVINAAGTCDY